MVRSRVSGAYDCVGHHGIVWTSFSMLAYVAEIGRPCGANTGHEIAHDCIRTLHQFEKETDWVSANLQ
jgi:hypothetical protein